MVCVSDILFVDGLALLGQQKDPILQILVSCHHKFGDSFPRQATEMDLSRLLDIKAPCSFCGGFLLLDYRRNHQYLFLFNQCIAFQKALVNIE